MQVKINLYFDGATGKVDWRIVTRDGMVIHSSFADFSGSIESTDSFNNETQAKADAMIFCELVNIQGEIQFYRKSNLQEPEITQ